MEIRRGIGVSGGYAIGEAFVVDREEYRISRRTLPPTQVEAQVERFQKAANAAAQGIRTQVEGMPKRVREAAAAILEAQIRWLQEPALHEEIIGEIRRSLRTADYAASYVIRRKIKAMEESDAAFARRVASDLVELEKSLLRELVGGNSRETLAELSGRAIIVAHDLSPGQTIGLDRTKVLGILTEAGGPTSHTAIVARSLGIPAVVGVEGVTNAIGGGDTVILDAGQGTVLLNPDEATLKRYQAMERNFVLAEQRRAKETQDLPAITKDGVRIEIFANIEAPDEIPAALEHGAEGIGLYRTEFLFLGHDFAPTEKDHYEAYTRATRLLGKRRIIIRTLDLGADKLPDDGFDREANPFLGTRAIRLCFERPDMFRTQLRAILRSTAMGNVGIMIPMISTLGEVKRAKEIVDDVRAELRREEEPAGEGISFGIMIEVPSAAVTADLLAPHVDFMSVGTNDLIAYSMAVDRANKHVASLFQPGHPAVLRLLKSVIEAGATHKKSVSICGEMSSDITFTLLLLGLGLRNFSVVPPVIPELKKLIRSVTIDEAKRIAAKALTFDDARDVSDFLRTETRAIMPEMS
ncbi:MAG TPA: phosphoenolpyruvate--protein phosphotransferase [Planctomycetota bacterium]